MATMQQPGAEDRRAGAQLDRRHARLALIAVTIVAAAVGTAVVFTQSRAQKTTTAGITETLRFSGLPDPIAAGTDALWVGLNPALDPSERGGTDAEVRIARTRQPDQRSDRADAADPGVRRARHAAPRQRAMGQPQRRPEPHRARRARRARLEHRQAPRPTPIRPWHLRPRLRRPLAMGHRRGLARHAGARRSGDDAADRQADRRRARARARRSRSGAERCG